MKKGRSLCESAFILIDSQALILKMVEIEAFLMKSKHQYLLSQLVERGCGAQC